MNNHDFILQNSSSYTREFSKFPHELIERHYFKDVDDTVGSLIHTINQYKSQGDWVQAANVIANHAQTLRQYIVDAAAINRIEEDIRNTQILALQKHQCVYFHEAEPELCAVGDIWEGGL